jgi:hypothetical protein
MAGSPGYITLRHPLKTMQQRRYEHVRFPDTTRLLHHGDGGERQIQGQEDGRAVQAGDTLPKRAE